ncbi:hypothetical protein ACI78R_14825 [Geodermatophilus sp. SYSU D01106]
MRRGLPCAVAALGLVLLVAGVVVFRRESRPSAVVYGGSYAPLTPTRAYESSLELSFDRVDVLWTYGSLLGAGLAVAGALVLAGVGGWALGRRSGRRAGR